MLGENAQQEIERLVHEFLKEKHDECEGDPQKIQAFLRVHDALEKQCWDRIKKYELFCTEYRKLPHIHRETGARFTMFPFDWRREQASTVRSLFRQKKGKLSLPLTALQAEARQMFVVKNYDVSPWREPLNTKIPRDAVLVDQDESSSVGAAYSHFKKIGKYPEIIHEGVEAVLANVAEKYGDEFMTLRKKRHTK